MILTFYIGGGHTGSTTSPPVIGSVAAADSCMLALDYAQNKVGYIQKYYDLLISLGNEKQQLRYIGSFTDLSGRILL